MVFVYSDDHGFSLLHWAAKEGHLGIVEMLVTRGARVNPTNLGDDIPLHLASAHGHRDVVCLVSFLPLVAIWYNFYIPLRRWWWSLRRFMGYRFLPIMPGNRSLIQNTKMILLPG